MALNMAALAMFVATAGVVNGIPAVVAPAAVAQEASLNSTNGCMLYLMCTTETVFLSSDNMGQTWRQTSYLAPPADYADIAIAGDDIYIAGLVQGGKGGTDFRAYVQKSMDTSSWSTVWHDTTPVWPEGLEMEAVCANSKGSIMAVGNANTYSAIVHKGALGWTQSKEKNLDESTTITTCAVDKNDEFLIGAYDDSYPKMWRVKADSGDMKEIAMPNEKCGGLDYMLKSVEDPNTIWGVCGNSVLINTNDGGDTWSAVNSTHKKTLQRRVAPINATHGFMMAEYCDDDANVDETRRSRLNRRVAHNNYNATHDSPAPWSVEILRTTDGGVTWTNACTDASECLYPTAEFGAINFVSADVGFVGTVAHKGQGSIFRTVDGGKTWTKVFTQSDDQPIFFPSKFVTQGSC